MPAAVACDLIEMSLAGLIGSFLVPGGVSQNGWCGKVICHGHLLCCNVLQALDPEDYEARSDRDIEASYATNVFNGFAMLCIDCCDLFFFRIRGQTGTCQRHALKSRNAWQDMP